MCEGSAVDVSDDQSPENLMFGREDLARSVELILAGGPDAAAALARLLDEFRDAIDGGLRGVEAARRGLVTAIELAYLRTGEHAAALRLYRLSLEGRLLAADEPARLLGAAIERRTPGARASAAQGK